MSGVNKFNYMTLLLTSRCPDCGEEITPQKLTNHICRISKDLTAQSKLLKGIQNEKLIYNGYLKKRRT